ncbi:hypothetical protein AB2N04_15370 [Nitratireductor sp. GISD-1A_MAKvit]|uniref:hypothetical protein n=1 Tax=Nitratireductor sp. GISD-1A_MAKvit TaxID=3234198 RepID=UPI003466D2AC
MCVRVGSGGRIFLLWSISLCATPAFGADPFAHDALNRYRAAQAAMSKTRPAMSGVIEYRQFDGTGRHALQPARHSTVHASGKLNHRIGAGWNVQKNLKHRRAQSGHQKMQQTQGSVHVYHRNPASHAAGAFVAVGETHGQNAEHGTATPELRNRRRVATGLEAALFSDKATLLALAGVRTGDFITLRPESAFAGLGARYYLTDQLRFEVRGTYEHPLDKTEDAHAYGLTSAIDYRPDELPFSTFGGYRYRLTEYGRRSATPDEIRSHGIFAGFRYHFGNDTLQEEERFGALWPDLPEGL